MPRHLDDLSIVNWLWHDAEVHDLKVEWPDTGGAVLCLRCEINPEEDRQPLIDLDITSQLVEVQFRDIRRLRTDLVGYNAIREVVSYWDTIQPSPLIKELQDHGLAGNVNLIHQQIRCSGGSRLDIVFTQIWLENVASEEHL